MGCSLQEGSLVTDWLREMSVYVKSLDPHHMVSSGAIGFRLRPPDTGDMYVNNTTLDKHLDNMVGFLLRCMCGLRPHTMTA